MHFFLATKLPIGIAKRGLTCAVRPMKTILIAHLLSQLLAAPQEPAVPPSVRLVAMTIMYEATNQPELGQRLVAHVVVNRWRKSGMPLEAVVFQRYQFAGWTEGRRDDWLLSTALECEECFKVYGDFGQMVAIAQEVVNGAPEPEGYEGTVNFDNLRFWPETGEPASPV